MSPLSFITLYTYYTPIMIIHCIQYLLVFYILVQDLTNTNSTTNISSSKVSVRTACKTSHSIAGKKVCFPLYGPKRALVTICI